jgi:hypothetical protein
MLVFIKQAVTILLSLISLVSFLLTLYFTSRYTRGDFITRKTLYYVTFFLLLSLGSGALVLWIIAPQSATFILFCGLFLSIGIIIFFGITLFGLSRVDKKDLRRGPIKK